MAPGASDGLAVDWEEALAGSAALGWAHAPAAFAPSLAEKLAPGRGHKWRLLGDEGRVKQHAFGSYVPFERAPALVRTVGAQVDERMIMTFRHNTGGAGAGYTV